MKAPIVGRKRGSQRLKPVPPSMRPKKPVRGKGKVKPPTREVPPLRGKKPIRGRGPVKPPTREVGKPTLDKGGRGKVKLTPMPDKPRRGVRKPMPIGGGRKVPLRGAMSRKRTR